MLAAVWIGISEASEYLPLEGGRRRDEARRPPDAGPCLTGSAPAVARRLLKTLPTADSGRAFNEKRGRRPAERPAHGPNV